MSDPGSTPRGGVAPTTAARNGPAWGERADDWADLCAGLSRPAWEAVVAATGIGAGTRVLDVGCGSGEFCQLAAARGATTSGIDAAERMIAIARRRLPHADLRVGAMESLPWDDDSFDVVTGFNSFQFAADLVAALVEAKRVARPGGRVAICNWGRRDDSQLFEVLAPVRDLAGPGPSGQAPAVGEPGVLEQLARRAGLDPLSAGEVDVPQELADRATLERALLAPGGVVRAALARSGERVVRETIAAAATPFRRPDGSYRLLNRFRYLIAGA
jgi:SAM-dependent methyltransferase